MNEKLLPESDGAIRKFVNRGSAGSPLGSPFTSIASCEKLDVEMESTKNQLGTLNGVYVPCLLNILGAVLFLRVGFSVGQLGVVGTFAVFIIAECIAISTVLSLSAIVSNGDMKGGGCYYMISRSLGPAFGASSGLLFYLSYAVGITFYIIAFSDTVVAALHPGCAPYQENICELSESAAFQLNVGLASSSLLVILCVSMLGAGVFAKVNVFVFVLLVLSIIINIFSIIFKKHSYALDTGGEYLSGFNVTNFAKNLFPEMNRPSIYCGDARCDIAKVFAIVFPAVTGIMEGANLSGDLKNPGSSIGKGTLFAIFTSFIVYSVLIITQAFHFNRIALQDNVYIMQETNVHSLVSIIGISNACVSSALGSLFGGPRVLQAIARDRVLPLKIFGYGTKKGDEPLIAVLLTWVIAQSMIFVGSLDKIASLITNFFLTAYATTNFACFLLEVSGVPNFRPKFKYYTWWTALIGGLLNFGTMFYLNPPMASITLVLMFLIYMYVVKTAGKHTDEWGNIDQAILYFYVRKFLLRIDASKEHVKYWRSSVLLLWDEADVPVLQFCNKMKKGGLYVVGIAALIEGSEEKKKVSAMSEWNDDRADTYERIEEEWQSLIQSKNIKAFVHLDIATTAATAYRNLILSSGLGGLRPALVVLPLMGTQTEIQQQVKRNRSGATRRNGSQESVMTHTLPVANATEYVQILEDVLILNKGLIVLSNTHKLESSFEHLLDGNPRSNTDTTKTIDLWLIGDWDVEHMDASMSLLLQVGHILRSNAYWQTSVNLRILRICTQRQDGAINDNGHPDVEERKLEMKNLIKRVRIKRDVTEIHIVNAPTCLQYKDAVAGSNGWIEFCRGLNGAMKMASAKSALILTALPPMPTKDNPDEAEAAYQSFADGLRLLSDGLPPIGFVAKKGKVVVATAI